MSVPSPVEGDQSVSYSGIICRYPGRSSKAFQWVTIIAAMIGALGAVLAAWITSRNQQSIQVLTTVIGQIERSVASISDVSVPAAIANIQKDTDDAQRASGGSITCNESKEGDDIVVTWSGQRENYRPGRYDVAASPDASQLLRLAGKAVYRIQSLEPGVSRSLSIDGRIVGASDPIPFDTPETYIGSKASCDVDGNDVTISEKMPLNNLLLGCARAAAFADSLRAFSNGDLKLALGGREYRQGSKAGDLRLVRVVLYFRNLKPLAKDAHFCPA